MNDVDLGGKEAAWTQLFHVVRDQFPYSKMKGVLVQEGAVVSFREVQYTFMFGRGVEPPRCLLPETFDEQWRRFVRFCQALDDGVLGEVHFSDGRPVLVSMQQGGMTLSAQPEESGERQGGESRPRELVAA